ncbi:acyl-CoA dehydrogenase family protein [Candidatus Viridilinea mediisalina]|uniref:Acyl-CoA dehydrogenase n=1 Tax=Candidatus Viridilinea mediisalina TaxID=2024553 RepID=A0A2A6RKK3_9CHLR|nr:acyl-CoA dehydrogenase family protein [Candidatus Viridilinea mediisalina]PDW03562.1 acyl-CoA dehydrogenase [Candidatus Viridilinea mediisalina]
MEYEHSDEIKMLRQTVRDFVDKEIRPIARQLDEEERVPIEVVKQAGELGLLSVPFPEADGGLGLGITGYCVLMEELNRVCASTATIVGAHTQLAAASIWIGGTEAQKDKYLKGMMEGRLIGAWALTEPNAGSDAARITTTAELRGDEWVLNGQKMWITNGNFADVIVVHAVTDKSKGARGGVTAFIVEKDFPGFKVGKIEEKMGLKASHTCSLFFEDLRVPAENILGGEEGIGKGFPIAMMTLDIGRVGLGAGALGSAKEAFELSRKYAVERQQFGRPIAEFQAIQFKLADMAVKIYTMEQIVYDCSTRVDAGKKSTIESSICKLYCTEMASEIIDEAIQIHGGMGFSRELPLERMYRDARVTRIFEGTNEIQKSVIATELLKQIGYRIHRHEGVYTTAKKNPE